MAGPEKGGTVKPVMITMAPSRNRDPRTPYPDNSFFRMAKDLGRGNSRSERYRFLGSFEMRTLVSKDPSQWGPMDIARESARMVRKELEGRTAVLVGRSVALAFGLGPHPLFKWTNNLPGVRGARVAVVPCPSVGPWWTDEENRERAGQFFRELLGAPE